MEILNGAPLAERNTVTGFPTYLLTSLMTSRLFIRAWPVAHLGACACSDQSGLCGTAARGVWHGARTEPENATSEVIA